MTEYLKFCQPSGNCGKRTISIRQMNKCLGWNLFAERPLLGEEIAY